ncbi:MAG TPA: DUF2341 domain-containing protein [Kofleriaceae bacterium]|jgi:hypothetical protein
MRRAALLLAVVSVGCGFKAGGSAASSDAAPDDADDAGSDIAPADADVPVDGTRTDWYDARFLHRRKLTIATNKLTGDVAGFPVLVTLPSAVGVDLTTGANDLRFVSMDNTTVFPYELDTFNAAANTTAWVKLTLSKSDPTTTLWVYYGFPDATSSSNGATVFGAFTSVHHLSNFGDSTANNHTVSAVALSTPGPTAGAVGGAQSFDGNDDYLEMANSGGMNFTTTMSVSAWLKVSTFDKVYQCIVCKGDGAWRLARADMTNGVGFGTTTATLNDNVNGNTSVSNGSWHHVVGVIDGTKKTLYVDGAKDLDENFSSQLDNTSTLVRLGMNVDSTTGGTRNWFGAIDEIRVTSAALGKDWVNAEYITVHDMTFVTVGADEAY